MKKRILAILVVALCAGFAMFSGVSRADQKDSPTCGQNSGHFARAVGLTHSSAKDEWIIVWEQDCSYTGSVEWELQYYDTTSSSWVDMKNGNLVTIDYLYSTTQSDANIDEDVNREVTTAANCYNSINYRLRIYSASGPTSAALSGSC